MGALRWWRPGLPLRWPTLVAATPLLDGQSNSGAPFDAFVSSRWISSRNDSTDHRRGDTRLRLGCRASEAGGTGRARLVHSGRLELVARDARNRVRSGRVGPTRRNWEGSTHASTHLYLFEESSDVAAREAAAWRDWMAVPSAG
jgi:hypothetical protein